MIGKLFFTADGGGKHPGPTYFRDFAPIPFGKLMVLLITSIWNVCLFHFIAWLHPHGKKYFPGPDKRFIEKWLLERKFARNPLKTPVKEQQQKFTIHNLLSFTWNFQVPETSACFPNSENNSYRSTIPLYFIYARHKTHNTLLISLIQYPYCPAIYNQPSDSCTPKLM